VSGTTRPPWVVVLPFVVFGILVVARLADPGNTAAAGAELLALELLALMYHLRAARRPGLTRAERRPWWLTSAAIVVLIAGGVGFSLVAPFGDDTPWSPAIVLAIAGRGLLAPILLTALLSFGSTPMDRRTRWKLCMDVTTVLGAGLMLAWYLVLGPALEADALLDPLRLASVVFSVGDVVLLVGIATVLLRGATTSTRRPLLLLMAGTLIYLAIDVFFMYQAVRPAVSEAIVPSVLLVPVFLILLAAIRPSDAGSGAARTATRLLRRTRYVPHAAVACGYGLLLIVAARTDVFPWLGLVIGALLITLSVSARQIASARENYSLIVTDSLTGLANRVRLRAVLADAVERRGRAGPPIAVLLIDLDGFKLINDTYGHEAGDQLLIRFADVLRRAVRDSDVPARLGGDEFAVVLRGVEGAGDATTVAQRILHECERPVEVSGHQLRMRASIGVAVDPGTGDCDPHELLHRADAAMYRAKRGTKNAWVLHSEDEADTGCTAAELTHAIDDGQLRLLYQPIVDLVTGEVVAVEALVRWQHPVRGLLGPDLFIPLAEKSGVIHELDLWVLEEACRQVGEWRAALPPGRSLYLSVNMAPAELERPTLADDVLRVLARVGFDPTGLVVEITEGALVDDRSALPHLEALRAQGIRVALDDFGTGYSSLRYLTRLPVDILKLDRCFVAELNGGPEHAAVADAVIRLSQILHLEAIAEGIEELEQATELLLLGYHNAQGYYFARPLAADEMAALLRRPTAMAPSLSTPDS
jgi:diguanylate cyclase